MPGQLTQAFVVAELLALWHKHDPSPELDFQRNAERAAWQAETLAGWKRPPRPHDRFKEAYLEAVRRIEAERAR